MDQGAEGNGSLSSRVIRCMAAGRKTQANLLPQGAAVSNNGPRSHLLNPSTTDGKRIPH